MHMKSLKSGWVIIVEKHIEHNKCYAEIGVVLSYLLLISSISCVALTHVEQVESVVE